MSIISKAQKIGRYITQPSLYRNAPVSLFRLRNVYREDPIIICGAPRSGTTLLVSILGSHSEILTIPYETWLFVNKRPQRWFKRESWNLKFIKLQLSAMLLSLKVTRFHRRWAEKTPDNVLHLDFIFSFFKGRVKVIHIIRDGRDVVLSHHKQLGNFMTPQKWVKYVEGGLRFREDPRVLTVHYEKLVADFDQTMQTISQFLNIKNTFRKDFYEATNVTDNKSVISGYGYKGVYVAKELSASSMSKWKNNPEVIRQFEEDAAARDLLQRLGYTM